VTKAALMGAVVTTNVYVYVQRDIWGSIVRRRSAIRNARMAAIVLRQENAAALPDIKEAIVKAVSPIKLSR